MFLVLFLEYLQRCKIEPVVFPLTYKQWLDMVRGYQREYGYTDLEMVQVIDSQYPNH